MKSKKNKRRKIKYKSVTLLLVIVFILLGICFFITNTRIENIYITGNSILTEQQIIDEAGIRKYPKIITLNKKRIINNLKKTDKIVDVVYCDEDKIDSKLRRYNPAFKPDYSPDTLLSFNYIGDFWCANKELLKICLQKLAAEGLEEITDWKVLRYKLLIMLSMTGVRFYHVRRVMNHKKVDEGMLDNYSVVQMQSVADCIRRTAIECGKEVVVETVEVVDSTVGSDNKPEGHADSVVINRVYYKVAGIADSSNCNQNAKDSDNIGTYRDSSKENDGTPLVSIIIPSKDNPKLLAICIDSIKRYTPYSDYEIIAVDNGSSSEARKEIEKYLASLTCHTEYIYERSDFNFSHMCNLGAKASNGDVVLFLNDDIEIIENNLPSGQDWLSVLTGQALNKESGLVGVRLMYPGGDKYQHIGIVNYEEAGFAHIYARADKGAKLYMNRECANYNYLCVTAACVAVAKDKFNIVGGFREDLKVTHNDVELGLNIYEAGYYNVLRNDVVLIHHESLTRGLDGEDEEKNRRNMRERELTFKLHPDLKKRDPFYSEYLSPMEFDARVNYEPIHGEIYGKVEVCNGVGKRKLCRRIDGVENKSADEIIESVVGSELVSAKITSVIAKDKLSIRSYAYSNKTRKGLKTWIVLEPVSYNDKNCKKPASNKDAKNIENDDKSVVNKSEADVENTYGYVPEVMYKIRVNNFCDRVFHKRMGLVRHYNFAEGYCNINLADIGPGEYRIKLIYKGNVIAEFDKNILLK